jgi:hypothetical protein
MVSSGEHSKRVPGHELNGLIRKAIRLEMYPRERVDYGGRGLT